MLVIISCDHNSPFTYQALTMKTLSLTAMTTTTAVPRTWCLIIRPRPSRWVDSRHPRTRPMVPDIMLKTTWWTKRLHAYTLQHVAGKASMLTRVGSCNEGWRATELEQRLLLCRAYIPSHKLRTEQNTCIFVRVGQQSARASLTLNLYLDAIYRRIHPTKSTLCKIQTPRNLSDVGLMRA